MVKRPGIPSGVRASVRAGTKKRLAPFQLDAVLALLDRHDARYWVNAEAISLDNEPSLTVIIFGKSGEAARIQAILDEAG